MTTPSHDAKNATLFDLVEALGSVIHDDSEVAKAVAMLVNSEVVRLEGRYSGRKVRISNAD